MASAFPDAPLVIVVAAVESAPGVVIAAEIVPTAKVVAAEVVAALIARARGGEGGDESLQGRLAAMGAHGIGGRKARQERRRTLAALVAPIFVDGHCIRLSA